MLLFLSAIFLMITPSSSLSGRVDVPGGGGDVFISSVSSLNTTKLAFTKAQSTACSSVMTLLPESWGERCGVATSMEGRDPEHRKNAFAAGGHSGLFYDDASLQHMISHWKLKIRCVEWFFICLEP